MRIPSLCVWTFYWMCSIEAIDTLLIKFGHFNEWIWIISQWRFFWIFFFATIFFMTGLYRRWVKNAIKSIFTLFSVFHNIMKCNINKFKLTFWKRKHSWITNLNCWITCIERFTFDRFQFAIERFPFDTRQLSLLICSCFVYVSKFLGFKKCLLHFLHNFFGNNLVQHIPLQDYINSTRFRVTKNIEIHAKSWNKEWSCKNGIERADGFGWWSIWNRRVFGLRWFGYETTGRSTIKFECQGQVSWHWHRKSNHATE